MISLEQFGQNVKAKYPDDVASDGRRYADIPDIEIAQRWIKANPEYASQVDDTASFGERVSSDIENRMDTINENEEETDMSSLGSVAANTIGNAGQVAGGITDIATEASKSIDRAVTGGRIEQLGENVMEKVAENPTVQKVGTAIAGFSQEHPDVAKTVGGAINIASAVPIVKGAQVAAKTIAGAAETGTQAAFKATGAAAKAVDGLEQDYLSYSMATKPNVKKLAKSDAKTIALNQAGTTGKTPQRVLAEHQIIPEHKGTKLSTAKQAQQFREDIQPLHDAMGEAIGEMRYAAQPLAIRDLEEGAVQRVIQQTMPEGDRATLIKDIMDEFSLLRQKYGDTMTVQEMFDSKPAYWQGTKFDSTKPFKSDSYYQVGKSMQKGIEDVATKAGFDDVAQLNREIGDRLEAAKFLESLDGQTVAYGKLGKYAAMGIGASLGNTLPAKVLGALGGEAVAQMLIDVNVSSPVKRLILRSVQKKSPEAYEATLKWIGEQKGAMSLRPLLNEGTMQLPAQRGEDFVKIVQAAKGEPGRTPKGTPKGGQYFRTFKSDIPSE